jgi:hypothetical protein
MSGREMGREGGREVVETQKKGEGFSVFKV